MKMKNLLALCLTALLLFGCAPKEPQLPTASGSTAQPTVPLETIPQPVTEPTVYEGIPVETPCGIVYLPDDWDEPITVKTTLGEPMVISFLAGDVPLYDLTFSEKASQAIGAVQTDAGLIYIGMMLHPLDAAQDVLLSMQESVNDLLAQLRSEPITPDSESTAGTGDLVLQTDYGQLHFPAKWEAYLLTEEPDDGQLEFYCSLPGRERVLLFTIHFGTAEGGLSAILTDEEGLRTPITFVPAEPEFDDDWSTSEIDLVYAMQEDMNVLLDAMQQ